MYYCTLTEFEQTVAQTLTTSSPDPATAKLSGVPAKLTTIGTKFNVNLVQSDDANYYIRLASSHIDAALSQQYVTPLMEKCQSEQKLLVDINEYSDSLSLSWGSYIIPGETIVLVDRVQGIEERVDVLANDGTYITPRNPILNTFTVEDTDVLVVAFPHPISIICARLAAAAMYDRYAKAQAEPGKSEFGDKLREEAYAELNNIREGRTILHGIERRGWRFANPNLVDRYTVKGAIDQDSTRTDPRKG